MCIFTITFIIITCKYTYAGKYDPQMLEQYTDAESHEGKRIWLKVCNGKLIEYMNVAHQTRVGIWSSYNNCSINHIRLWMMMMKSIWILKFMTCMYMNEFISRLPLRYKRKSIGLISLDSTPFAAIEVCTILVYLGNCNDC